MHNHMLMLQKSNVLVLGPYCCSSLCGPVDAATLRPFKLPACAEISLTHFPQTIESLNKAPGEKHTLESLQAKGDTSEYRWSISGCPNMQFGLQTGENTICSCFLTLTRKIVHLIVSLSEKKATFQRSFSKEGINSKE